MRAAVLDKAGPPEPIHIRTALVTANGDPQRLDTAIGSKTIPLRVSAFPLDDVVGAHLRTENGQVVGRLLLQIKR